MRQGPAWRHRCFIPIDGWPFIWINGVMHPLTAI
jgi:hypothetical protein